MNITRRSPGHPMTEEQEHMTEEQEHLLDILCNPKRKNGIFTEEEKRFMVRHSKKIEMMLARQKKLKVVVPTDIIKAIIKKAK